MNSFEKYLLPRTISQVAGLLILFPAWKKPVWTRCIFGCIFIAAGLFNGYTAMTHPEAYPAFAETAIILYREFITGWFRNNIGWFIPLIATGQVITGSFMFIGRKWLAAGCLGIIIFLMSIAPPGIGSAFPFSITESIAAFLVFYHDQKQTKKPVANCQ